MSNHSESALLALRGCIRVTQVALDGQQVDLMAMIKPLGLPRVSSQARVLGTAFEVISAALASTDGWIQDRLDEISGDDHAPAA